MSATDKQLKAEEIDDILDEIEAKEKENTVEEKAEDQSIDWGEIIDNIRKQNIGFVKGIIGEREIEVNARNPKDGKTLLSHAVVIGNVDLVRAILNFGAKTDIKDNDGFDSFDYALKYGNYKITQMIYFRRLSGSVGNDLKRISEEIHLQSKEAEYIWENKPKPIRHGIYFYGNDFAEKIVDFTIKAIKERAPLNSNWIYYSWYFELKDINQRREVENKKIFESKLWKAIMEVYQGILCNTKDHDGWKYLKETILTSLIWFQSHPVNGEESKDVDVDDEYEKMVLTVKRTLFYELFHRVQTESKKQSNLLLKHKIDLIQKTKPNEWNDLIAFSVNTKHSKNARQDLCGCLVPKYSEDDLSEERYPPSTHFSALKHYDTNIYLNELLFNANIINDRFQNDMKRITKEIGKEMNAVEVPLQEGDIIEMVGLKNKSQNGKFAKIIGPFHNRTQRWPIQNQFGCREKTFLPTVNAKKHKPEPTFLMGPVKTQTRSQAKVENDYIDDDYPKSSKILDINRCAIQFDSIPQMMKFIHVFMNKIKTKNARSIIEIIRCKNGWSQYDMERPQYTDIKLNVLVKAKTPHGVDTIIAEIQFLLDLMSKFKKVAHKLYSVERKVELVFNYTEFTQEMKQWKDIESSDAVWQDVIKDDDDDGFKALWLSHDGTIKWITDDSLPTLQQPIFCILKSETDKIHRFLKTTAKDAYIKAIIYLVNKAHWVQHFCNELIIKRIMDVIDDEDTLTQVIFGRKMVFGVEPEPEPLQKGDIVQLMDVEHAPHWNGKFATIIKFVEEKQLWMVRFKYADRALQPKNLNRSPFITSPKTFGSVRALNLFRSICDHEDMDSLKLILFSEKISDEIKCRAMTEISANPNVSLKIQEILNKSLGILKPLMTIHSPFNLYTMNVPGDEKEKESEYKVDHKQMDRALYCFGFGAEGQLGNTRYYKKNRCATPILCKPLPVDCVDVSASVRHTLCIDKYGDVHSFGLNKDGQCGLENIREITSPTPLKPFSRYKVVSVSAGEGHSLILLSDGSLWSFGRNNYGQLGVGMSDEKINKTSTPKRIEIVDNHIRAADVFYTQISCGANHCCAISKTPQSRDTYNKTSKSYELFTEYYISFWTWGYNHKGQCGFKPDKSNNKISYPRVFPGKKLRGKLPAKKNKQQTLPLKCCAKADETFIITTDHHLLHNYKRIESLKTPIVDAAIGFSKNKVHYLCIDNNGTLYSWGDGSFGKLGHVNYDKDYKEDEPKRVAFFAENNIKLRQCDAGDDHSVVVTTDGDLYVFGNNPNGQLGLGNYRGQRKPVKVSHFGNAKVWKVSAGSKYTAVITESESERKNEEMTLSYGDIMTKTKDTEDAMMSIWNRNKGLFGDDKWYCIQKVFTDELLFANALWCVKEENKLIIKYSFTGVLGVLENDDEYIKEILQSKYILCVQKKDVERSESKKEEDMNDATDTLYQFDDIKSIEFVIPLENINDEITVLIYVEPPNAAYFVLLKEFPSEKKYQKLWVAGVSCT